MRIRSQGKKFGSSPRILDDFHHNFIEFLHYRFWIKKFDILMIMLSVFLPIFLAIFLGNKDFKGTHLKKPCNARM